MQGLTKRQISQAKFRLDGITKNGIRCRVTETTYPGDVIRVCLEEAQTASAHLENYNFKIDSKTQAGLHCDKASIPVSETSLSLDIVMRIQIFWQLINRREWLRIRQEYIMQTVSPILLPTTSREK